MVYTPIPLMFKDVVERTEEVVKITADVPYLRFFHGKYLDFTKELTLTTDGRYPAVFLIHEIEETTQGSENKVKNIDLLIVTETEKGYDVAQRYEKIYPTLNDIYLELKIQILRSKYFTGYPKDFNFTKVDLIHFGDYDNKGTPKYLLPDNLDAILIPKLELTLNNLCN